MSSPSPLSGIALVDCARANADKGIAVAAERSGYGNDTAAFQSALNAACADMGVDVSELSDLVPSEQAKWHMQEGMEVAPDTPGDL